MAKQMMDREELERKVLEGLNIQKPCHIPVVKKAIRMKTDKQLEDILNKMNPEGGCEW